MFEQYKLKNKANILLIPQDNTHSVTVLVVYPVGSRYEPKKLNGVSHYIEHLMFKGTKKRKNTLILTREIDRLGAEYNAFTGKENTGYYIKTDCNDIEKSLDILSDMLYNSVFDAKEMEREKTVIVEELRMYRDNPIMNIDNIFEGLMYEGPLGWDIGGTESNVLNFNRNEVLGYKQKYYDPSNAIVVVAGHITDSVKDLIEKYFGKEKNKFNPSKKFVPHEYGNDSKEKRLKVERKSTDQVQMMLGFPGLEYNNKQNTVASVMNSILGGSMSSRLFIQIRERRGLAYSIHSGTENFRDAGYMYVGVGLEAKNINKAISVIKDELEKLVSRGVTTQELRDAKTHFRGKLSLGMENSSAVASFYARQALFADKIKSPAERLAEAEAVTKSEIQKLARKVYNTKKMRVAIIGDVKKEDIKF
ncbi:MAG: pitrilysin family protein [bacterium]|nr:pitrilysin family protein [bacterium]